MIRQFKSMIKEAVLIRLNIPYSRHGLPIALMHLLEKGVPITMIDVGAHLGHFTETVSKHTKIKQAILVEPIPALARKLHSKFNPSIHTIINGVLSDSNGFVEFEVNDVAATSSLLAICRDMSELSDVGLGTSIKIQCKARTLDEVTCEAGMGEVHLLKIDVQGAEHLVLRGATETLKRTNIIWIEVSYKPLYENACTFSEIYELLYSSGFILKGLEPAFCGPDGELLQGDALFVKKGV